MGEEDKDEIISGIINKQIKSLLIEINKDDAPNLTINEIFGLLTAIYTSSVMTVLQSMEFDSKEGTELKEHFKFLSTQFISTINNFIDQLKKETSEH